MRIMSSQERMKKIELLSNVHFRPIISARGPAMKGAVKEA